MNEPCDHAIALADLMSGVEVVNESTRNDYYEDSLEYFNYCPDCGKQLLFDREPETEITKQ